MSTRLTELLDLQPVQSLMESFYELFGISACILDTNGKILVKTTWQEFCEKSPRFCPLSEGRCRSGAAYLKDQPLVDAIFNYKCPYGMQDYGIPIMYDNKILGTLLVGQFYLEAPLVGSVCIPGKQEDDEAVDFEALQKVPILSHEQKDSVFNFLRHLTGTISSMVSLQMNRLLTTANFERQPDKELPHRVPDQTTSRQGWLKMPLDIGYNEISELHLNIGINKIFGDSLSASGEKVFTLLDNMNEIIFTTDLAGNITYISPALEKVGFSPAEVNGTAFAQYVHPDDLDEFRIGVKEAYAGKHHPREFRIIDKNDDIRHARACSWPLILNGQCIGLFGFISEITAEKIAQEKLWTSEQRYRQLLEKAPLGIITMDRDWNIIDINPKMLSILGFPSLEATQSIDFTSYPPLIESGVIENWEKCLRENTAVVFEHFYTSKWGKTAYLRYHIAPLPDNFGNIIGIQSIVEDFSDRKMAEDGMRFLSIHDPLTGLYNRSYFEELIENIDRTLPSLGLILCDIDGLKIINDSFGHNTGDKVLQAAAAILQKCISDEETLARIGGDEFIIIIPNCTPITATELVYRIRREVAYYNARVPELPLSMALGFALRSGPAQTLNEMFKLADANMCREKLTKNRSARSAIVQTLIKALEARDFITDGHASRIQELVSKMAVDINLPEHKTNDLMLLAQFHDIGKVGIPDRILFKPGPLNADERAEMQRHCEIGHRIALAAPDLAPIADYILKHHEWWNGKGYPLGLKGEGIPLKCRLLAIVDAYDAMTNDRPYREAMQPEEALKELQRNAGTQFDPELVGRFIKIIKSEFPSKCIT